MAIVSSGAIPLSALQTEFGGSNPVSLSEYYRGGSYTTSNNTGVPTSGAISLSQFYSTTAADYIPAAVAWGDVVSSDDGSGTGQSIYTENSNQTFTSITAAITLSISVPSFNVNCSGATPGVSGYLDIIKNGSVVATLSKSRFTAGSTTSAASTTVSVASGDTLRFAAYCTVSGGVGGSSGGGGGTVSIINQSSGNTTLDTFVFTLTASNDGSGGP